MKRYFRHYKAWRGSGSGSGGTVVQIDTTGPITGGPITTSGTIGITQADSTTDGYLSSIDWNIFDSKQGAITLTTVGDGGKATFVANVLNVPQIPSKGFIIAMSVAL